MGEIFENHLSCKELISIIYSKSLKLNNKKSDSKMDRELKQTFLLRRDANGQIST
jgi:hypothetical protein